VVGSGWRPSGEAEATNIQDHHGAVFGVISTNGLALSVPVVAVIAGAPVDEESGFGTQSRRPGSLAHMSAARGTHRVGSATKLELEAMIGDMQ
jgi:hypothetical protein